MSSNTDDLGNAKKELSDGSALFALPHDPGLAAESIQQDIGAKTDSDSIETPDPTADGDGQTLNPHEDGGPLRRFTDIKSPLGMVGLESLAKDEDEVAKAISARSDEIYRNEFPVIVPKFEAKCQACGAEFDDEDIEVCRTRGCESTDFVYPDYSERPEIKSFFESVNREGQSMRQLGKITDEDHSRLGTLCWVLRWDYLTGPRQVSQSIGDAKKVVDVQFEELVRGDPKRVVPVVDPNGRVGGVWWTCPVHRQESVVNANEYEEGVTQCPECGCDLREVHYVELEGAGGDDLEKYYFEHEIVMYAGHVPQAHGLDGLSPVHLVWLEQAILHWMDVYAAEFFNPHSERTPNKFLIVHTPNPDSFEAQLDEAKDEASENPYKSGIFYNQVSPQQNANTEAQVIDVMGDEFLGQSENLRKRFENHIRTVFGVTDVFDSELEDAGGLNNEGLQLEVTDRSIAAAQQDYTDGPYDELLRYLGYDDWVVKFVPPRETDLEEQMQAVKLLQEAARAGLPARMENGEPVIGDGEAEAPDAGGMEPPGDDGMEPISRDEAEEEFGGGTGNSTEGAGQKQSGVPDNAVSITDPSEAPEDAQLYEGPRGGLYYTSRNGQDENGGGSNERRNEIRDEVEGLVEDGDREAIDSMIADSVGVDDVSTPIGLPDDQLVEFTATLSHAGELGLTSQVERVETHTSDEAGFYRFNDGTLSFNWQLDEDEQLDFEDGGEAVGDDVEWLVMHELGHAAHDETVDDMVGSEEFFDRNMAVGRDGDWAGIERVDLVDDEVSSYGTTNPAEFVAEVFSGLATGEEFSDEVMEIYEEFDGPDSWRDYRGDQ